MHRSVATCARRWRAWARRSPPAGGVAELVGIATLGPYRRRGVAASLTTYAAQTAFTLGVDLVYLSTTNPDARRVYERLGFQPCAVQLTFTIPHGELLATSS